MKKILYFLLAIISSPLIWGLPSNQIPSYTLTNKHTRAECEQGLNADIDIILKNLKDQGYTPEKMADARLYMDLLREKYRIQVELLIMDRTAFTITGLGARLRAPFIVYGNCKDASTNGTTPIDLALTVRESESYCKRRLREEIDKTLVDLKVSGISQHIVELAKYYMNLVNQLQEVDLKLNMMDRLTFPMSSILGQMQDPFISYERCRNIPIVTPL